MRINLDGKGLYLVYIGVNIMNNPTELISSNNNEVISSRIERIQNAIFGVKFLSAKFDQGIAVEGMPVSNYEETRSIFEIMETDGIPGCCLALINNFEVEWVKAYGVKKIGTKEPITLNTLFQAASISKVLMTMMALHYVDQKLLALDKPISNYFSDWKIPDNKFTKDTQITLHQILTHTSGLNSPEGGFSREEGSLPSIIQVLNGEAPAKNKPAKVEFKPGSKFQYSNMGFIILEKLLQDITGKEINDIAKEVLFDPIGIKDSYFVYPSEDLQKRMIYPHDADGKAYEPHIGLSPGIYGCGGLITTPFDLAKIAIELMNTYQGKSNKVLSTSLAKQMLTSNLSLDPLKMWGLTDFGLGVFLTVKENDSFFDHKGGNYPGASSVLMANPQSGQGLVIMSNSITGHKQLFESLKFTIARDYNWALWTE